MVCSTKKDHQRPQPQIHITLWKSNDPEAKHRAKLINGISSPNRRLIGKEKSIGETILVTFTFPEAWSDWIVITTAIHNNRQNATTKLSPNEILLGNQTKLIPTETTESTNEATEQWLEIMVKKRLAAIDTINQMAKTKAPISSQYKEGDQGWLEVTHLRLRHQKTKLTPKHYEPFRVIKEVSPVVYRIQLLTSLAIHDVFHPSLLSPCHKTASHGPNFSRPPPDLIDGEKKYKVEHIVNHYYYGKSRRLQYLIKWKEYPESDNT